MSKILMVVGSTHTNGFNLQLAKHVEKAIGDRAEVSFLDYSDVPFMSEDDEFPAPEAVTRVREELKNADGVWFFAPTYNGTYTAYMKNLLDWVSRPLEPNVRETAVSNGIKVTFSAAAGQAAGADVIDASVTLAKRIGMNVMANPLTGIALTDAWMTRTVNLTDEQQALVNAQVDAFLKFIA